MNGNFFKKLMFVTGVMTAVGILMIIVGGIFGGFTQLKSASEATGMELIHFNKDKLSINKGKTKKSKGEQKVSSKANIDKLDIDCGNVNVSIYETSDDDFSFSSDGSGIKVYSDDDTFVVDAGHGKGNLEVYIPEKITLKKCRLKLGGGDFNINKLSAKKCYFEIGAGDLEIHNAIIQDELEASIGMGNMTLSGEINGDIKVECGLGNVELDLDNEEKEFDYEVKVAMGNLNIGNNQYSGIVDTKIDNHSNNKCKIKCGAGNVDLSF